ncbi:reverse transcriptase domain-containing protein [Tanacetum coccineum]
MRGTSMSREFEPAECARQRSSRIDSKLATMGPTRDITVHNLTTKKGLIMPDSFGLQFTGCDEDNEFGAPRAIISDRGTHFCNDQFAKIMLKVKVKKSTSTKVKVKTEAIIKEDLNGSTLTHLMGRGIPHWTRFQVLGSTGLDNKQESKAQIGLVFHSDNKNILCLLCTKKHMKKRPRFGEPGSFLA